ILRYLGEGLTAEVWAARRDDKTIALKILKPDLPADIVNSFSDEATILSSLATFERQEGDGLSLIPRVEGRAFEPQLPFKFLGLELVQGIPLTDLIERQGGLSGKLGKKEKKALLIANQVLRVLDILHTHLRRSYTDFQLKNIWWQEEAGQVKVMDWNHVSLPAAEGERLPGIANDLLRFGAYLYQILTGKGVGEGSLNDGRTEFQLAKPAGQHWQNISVGTRAIILQALHPNPNQRWQTAQAVRQAVQLHQKQWQEPVGDISTEAVRAIRTVRRSEPQDAPEHIQQAELYIDLYMRRGEDKALVERLQNELAELTRNVSANWGSGLQYYKAGIHSKSTPIWQEEAAALGRLELWRWVALSQLGESVSSDLFEAASPDLEAALQFMEDEDWEAAAATLQKVQAQGISGEPLWALTNECQAHLSFREAQKKAEWEQWTDAAVAYRETADRLSQIPPQYRVLLQESYGWQTLEAKAQEYADKAIDSDTNRQLLVQLQETFVQNFDDGLKLFHETIEKTPDNPALPKFVEDTAVNLSPQQAIDLLLTVLDKVDEGSLAPRLRQILADKRAAQKQAKEEAQLADLRQTFATDFDDGV
ncbi:MAG: hypothetical protein GY805_24120, partial [Chloroflexi bacterium]|nr:hypothetical protein [Chloroflexota bacterium]